MQIPLSQIHPNPYRDFDLHPIDPAQVDRLKASMDLDGFWASVVARKVADGYQLAYGHHRIEAARTLGMTSVPLEVRQLNDWQMVRMLATENATQRGIAAAAGLDAVQAICRLLAYELLRHDEATFARVCPKVAIDYASCRGRLEAGSGIGTSCVLAFAPPGSLTEHQIRQNLAVLKQSGRMADLIAAAQAQVAAELRVEQQEAEAALAEAQAAEADAATKPERRAAARATKTAKQVEAKVQLLQAGPRRRPPPSSVSRSSTTRAAPRCLNPTLMSRRSAQPLQAILSAATCRWIGSSNSPPTFWQRSARTTRRVGRSPFPTSGRSAGPGSRVASACPRWTCARRRSGLTTMRSRTGSISSAVPLPMGGGALPCWPAPSARVSLWTPPSSSSWSGIL
jgi:hypothetical protein